MVHHIRFAEPVWDLTYLADCQMCGVVSTSHNPFDTEKWYYIDQVPLYDQTVGGMVCTEIHAHIFYDTFNSEQYVTKVLHSFFED
jgi:hypothetical protein